MQRRLTAFALSLLYLMLFGLGETLTHHHDHDATHQHADCAACVWHQTHQAVSPAEIPQPGRLHHERIAIRIESQQPRHTFFSPAAPSQAPPAVS